MGATAAGGGEPGRQADQWHERAREEQQWHPCSTVRHKI